MFNKIGIMSSNSLEFRIRTVEYVAGLVIGMTESTAIDTIADYGYTSRVVSRDGNPVGVLDFVFIETRINLDIENNIVVQVYIG